MASFENEKDDFWDVSKLVPKKAAHPSGASLSRFSSGAVCSSYTVEGGTAEKNGENRLSFSGYEKKTVACDEVYTPEWNPLIRSVTVRHTRDSYDFYGSFRKAALLYFEVPSAKCDFVPFYSYMPQYAQMNAAQKAYYFYFRSEVRVHRFPKTDYSYLYLYVYEILNLPDKIPPKEGLIRLCEVWAAYRKGLPRIDLFFSVWVQDYCLIYRLPSPSAEIAAFLPAAISACGFKEFYLEDLARENSRGVGAAMAYLSDYDYRCGKYAGGEHADAYRKHMEGAIGLLLTHLFSAPPKSGLLSMAGAPAVLTREAFPSSLCTHEVKARLTVEYYPLSQADALRRSFTDAVKYTENKLRALLSVKSRLAVRDLPEDYRAVIDSYFEDVFARARRERAKADAPAYESRYEAPPEALSLADADAIESSSWSTTKRLVTEDEFLPAFPEENTHNPAGKDGMRAPETTPEERRKKSGEPLPAARKVPDSGDEPAPVNRETDSAPLPEENLPEKKAGEGGGAGLSAAARAFLSLVVAGDGDAARAVAAKYTLPVDTVAEEINLYFTDRIGDVVLVPDGETYTCIPDYIEDVNECLNN